MSYSLALPNPAARLADLVVHFLHGSILSLGFAVALLIAGAFVVGDLPTTVRNLIDSQTLDQNAQADSSTVAPAEESTEANAKRNARLLLTADVIAKKYRIAQPVIVDIVRTADKSARASGFDPMLVLAMIAVESRFNPYAESSFGAQGLMQVIGRFHTDKFEPTTDGMALLDMETNIRVGVDVLREYRRRAGSIEAALKLYGGESDESGMGYAEKVYAEKDRLEVAIQRAKKA
jgi:soluble lytic murein transglycosylase-like protein